MSNPQTNVNCDSTRIAPSKIIYPWPRFWCPRDGVLDLSDGGFLSDPTSHFWHGAQPQPKTLDQLSDYRALVLLGEPGLGKSTALETETKRVAGDAASIVSMREDLRAFSSEELLHRRIFDDPTFRAWEEGDSHLVLHLDSLDEALLRIDSIANLLAEELARRSYARMSLRIACRTAVWPGGILEPALTSLWGEGGVGVFELAPLRRADVVAAATARGIDPDAFIRALFEADAVPFAIKPLTLNLLFDIFQRDGRLPHSNGEIYRKGTLLLCEETSASRRGARRMGTLSPEQRLRVGGRIAATTMLANRYAIWTGIESGHVPEPDIVISALTGGRENGGFAGFEVDAAHIREVLDTGLFTARGPDEMGWAHQSYAEFLAAQYLVAREVSADNILKVLMHPSGGLVPQLGMVAAWIASLSATVRDVLIQNEPFVLLRADLSAWAPTDIAALTAAYLKALDDRRASDLMIGIGSFYHKLVHPGLDAQLRSYIADSSKFLMSRRAAIMIAGACKRAGLQSDLLGLALDHTENTALRASALAALRELGDDSIASQLRTFVDGTAGDDPHREMRGYALQILWPKHITAHDLFTPLTEPDEGYAGSYFRFLTYILPETLTPADLPAALDWARGYIAGAGHMGGFYFKSLADAILMRAWAHVDDAAIRASLVAYLRTVLSQAGELLRGTDHRAQEKFRKSLVDDGERRQIVMHALLQTRLEAYDAFHYRRSGLLQSSDLDRLLSLAPGGAAPDATLDAESLCNILQGLCDLYVPDQFDKIYEASQRWPELYARFGQIFEGVPLDSPAADQARRFQAMSNNYAQPAPAVSPPPAERIATHLTNFEAGNWRAFWRLNQDLTLEPTSQVYGLDFDYAITSMPGWISADASLRARILRAAEHYLVIGKTSVAGWIGTQRYKRNDLSAFRALVLLKQEDPAAYDRIPIELWNKWAPAIAAIPQEFNDDTIREISAVLMDAVTKAPAEFVRAVSTQIRRERVRAARPGTVVHSGASFIWLRNLQPCWQSSPLCGRVLLELNDPANTADQFAVLADTLLAAPFAPALDDLLAQLRDGTLTDPDKAVAAATALTIHALPTSWPVLWSRLQDAVFARAFFLALALRYAFRENIFSGLPDRALAEIYVLLERIFVRADDPVHPGGRVHAVGPLEQVAHLRDRIPGELSARATPEAVAALRWAVGELPSVSGLIFTLRRAEQLMRMRTWTPLSVAEVRCLTRDRKAMLVQTADDLTALLVAALRAYEQQLHGEQPSVRALWDRQGGSDVYRPVEEDALSDDVKRFLQRELADSGIVVNREVEIGRVPGAPVGTRTDIRVQAIRRGPGGEPLDTLVAVIETKGCWNGELFSALTDQLYTDYIVRLAAPVGIYLVGWFDKAKWDDADGRKRRTPNITREDAQMRLDAQAATIPAGAAVQSVILDCRLA